MNYETRKFIIEASNVFSTYEVLSNLANWVQEETLDWHTVLEEGRRHRILPAIYYNLSRLDLFKVPSFRTHALALKVAYSDTFTINSQYIRELSRILGCLAAKKLKVVLINGEILAYHFYPSLGTRPFSDCDLLVNPNTLSKVNQVLIEEGYIQGYGEKGEIFAPSRQEILFARLYMKHVIAFVRYEKELLYVIEPHFDLSWKTASGVPAFPLDVWQLISQSHCVELDGRQAWVLDSLNFLAYACLDVFEDAHRIEKIAQGTDLQLIKFLDLYAIIQSGIDWRAFVDIVEPVGLQIPVFFSLSCLQKLYPIVPTWVLDRVVPSATDFVDEFGFPEELVGKARCFYDRPFIDRMFDFPYRRQTLDRQSLLCKETTFQNLRTEGRC